MAKKTRRPHIETARHPHTPFSAERIMKELGRPQSVTPPTTPPLVAESSGPRPKIGDTIRPRKLDGTNHYLGRIVGESLGYMGMLAAKYPDVQLMQYQGELVIPLLKPGSQPNLPADVLGSHFKRLRDRQPSMISEQTLVASSIYTYALKNRPQVALAVEVKEYGWLKDEMNATSRVLRTKPNAADALIIGEFPAQAVAEEARAEIEEYFEHGHDITLSPVEICSTPQK